MKKIVKALFVLYIGMVSCTSTPNVEPVIPPAVDTIPADTSKFYLWSGLDFSADPYSTQRRYFSTIDTSFKGPQLLEEMSAKQLANVDLAYIYNDNEGNPGFIDPVSAGINLNYLYFPELAHSVQTVFYRIGLNRNDMDSIQKHPELLDTHWYGNIAGFFDIVENSGGYPQGAMVGGGLALPLSKTLMLAFKNVNSGKRGLIYIRIDQVDGWDIFFFRITSHTKVDILKEK